MILVSFTVLCHILSSSMIRPVAVSLASTNAAGSLGLVMNAVSSKSSVSSTISSSKMVTLSRSMAPGSLPSGNIKIPGNGFGS